MFYESFMITSITYAWQLTCTALHMYIPLWIVQFHQQQGDNQAVHYYQFSVQPQVGFEQVDQDKDVILQMIENTVNLQARNRQYVQNDDDMLSKFQDCKLNSWNQEAKILKMGEQQQCNKNIQ